MSKSLRTNNITQTYFALRLALALISFALPIVLYGSAHVLTGLPLQPSLSAYYYSDFGSIFVGSLFAIGMGLLTYKGFSRVEDWSLNIGGVLAVAIAVFPMQPDDAWPCIYPDFKIGESTLIANHFDRSSQWAVDLEFHYYCAILFFMVLAFVVTFCSHQTLHLVPLKQRRRFLLAYLLCGLLFVGSIGASYVILNYAGGATGNACSKHVLFGVECAGVFSFAIYWLVKTWECWRYDTDIRIPNRRRPHAVGDGGDGQNKAFLAPYEPAPADEKFWDLERYLKLWSR